MESRGRKLEMFIHFLRTRRLIDERRLGRTIRQYESFDRRFGQMSAFLGYIRPDHINTILLEKALHGGKFGQCAVRLKLMTPEQIARINGLQTDDLSIFSQAVGIQNAATNVEYTSFLTDFVKSNPDLMAEPVAPPADPEEQLSEKLRAVLARIEHISPLPGTVGRVVSMLENPEVDLDQVAQLLRMDPGLTSTLLRVSNSAFYGLRSKIGSTRKALHVLGTDKLRQLIIAAGILQKFQAAPSEYVMAFWQNAMRTAECAKSLGKYLRIQELDEIFVCGLLHNIGELVIRQFFHVEWSEIEAQRSAGRPVLETEQLVMGSTHADIGGFLFHIWKLPKATVQSAMYHHMDYEQMSRTPNIAEEVPIVHMAATLSEVDARMPAYEYARSLDAVGDFYRRRLSLPESLDIPNFMQRVDGAVEQMIKNFMTDVSQPSDRSLQQQSA